MMDFTTANPVVEGESDGNTFVIRSVLAAAGFGDGQVTDEYTYRPLDNESLRATWIARRRR